MGRACILATTARLSIAASFVACGAKGGEGAPEGGGRAAPSAADGAGARAGDGPGAPAASAPPSAAPPVDSVAPLSADPPGFVGCTLAGCSNGLVIKTKPLLPKAALVGAKVEVCRQGACRWLTFHESDLPKGGLPGLHPVSFTGGVKEAPTGKVPLRSWVTLPAPDAAGLYPLAVRIDLLPYSYAKAETVSLRVTTAAGVVVLDANRTARFEEVLPNGNLCPPVCHRAVVTFDE